MSGCRVFLLSREPLWLCSPLFHPLPVAGFPQGAARGEALERARAYGRTFAGALIDAFIYMLPLVCIFLIRDPWGGLVYLELVSSS